MTLRKIDASMIDDSKIMEEVDRKIATIQQATKVHTEELIATVEGQMSFVLKNVYNLSTDVITVQVGGVTQHTPDNYIKNISEQGVTTIVFTEGLPLGMDVAVNYYSNKGVNEVLEGHMNNIEEKHIKIIDSVTNIESYNGALLLKVSENNGYTPSAPINARS